MTDYSNHKPFFIKKGNVCAVYILFLSPVLRTVFPIVIFNQYDTFWTIPVKHWLISVTKYFILESTIALKIKAHRSSFSVCLPFARLPELDSSSQSRLESGHFLPPALGSMRKAAFRGRRTASLQAHPACQPRLLGNFVMAKVSNSAVVTGLLLPHFQPRSQTTAHIAWKSPLALTSLKLHQHLSIPPGKIAATLWGRL